VDAFQRPARKGHHSVSRDLRGARVTSASGAAVSGAAYVRAVTEICSGAVLFEDQHETGTRPDTLVVAIDIRASTRVGAAVSTVSPSPVVCGCRSSAG
jgi:hypothetical protein